MHLSPGPPCASAGTPPWALRTRDPVRGCDAHHLCSALPLPLLAAVTGALTLCSGGRSERRRYRLLGPASARPWTPVLARARAGGGAAHDRMCGAGCARTASPRPSPRPRARSSSALAGPWLAACPSRARGVSLAGCHRIRVSTASITARRCNRAAPVPERGRFANRTRRAGVWRAGARAPAPAGTPAPTFAGGDALCSVPHTLQAPAWGRLTSSWFIYKPRTRVPRVRGTRKTKNAQSTMARGARPLVGWAAAARLAAGHARQSLAQAGGAPGAVLGARSWLVGRAFAPLFPRSCLAPAAARHPRLPGTGTGLPQVRLCARPRTPPPPAPARPCPPAPVCPSAPRCALPPERAPRWCAERPLLSR